MSRVFRCFLLVLIAGGSVARGENEGLRLYRIGAFPGLSDEKPTEEAEGGEERKPVKYAVHFPRNSAGYITAQASFVNKRYAENQFSYEVTMGLYTYDNRPISAHKKKMVVAADWKYAWITQSYGWPDAGKWTVGTYRIKVWVDGELAGESSFYVYDDEKDPKANENGIDIRSIEFYEGGDFFKPGLGATPAVRFPRRSTRRIYWVARGKNLRYLERAQQPRVTAYFYRPDGSLMGVAPNRYLIAPEVENAVLVEGIGWSAPGNWGPGKYRFELEQDNRIVATRSFEITDPFVKPRTKPWAVHFGILEAGLFAGGRELDEEDAPKRSYVNRFSRTERLGIWGDLVVANNPNHTEPHSHEVRWEVHGPSGLLLHGFTEPLEIQPEWKTARQTVLLGYREPGEWPEGNYKVLLSIDGNLVKVMRFRMEGPGPIGF